MDAEQLEKLMYPIGNFKDPLEYNPGDIKRWIREIEDLPGLCRIELEQFSNEMLDESYKPGGWTARQVIHHIADSHMNAYIRFKLTLTEELPTIKPYAEALWAELPDSKAPIEISLDLLEVLHRRFVIVLKSINEEQFNRSYFHPGNNRKYSLKNALALYAWHGKHHLEHVRIVRRKFAMTEK
jgi:hypothetical protein